MYSFPNERQVEVTVRHEFGHAFHGQYKFGNIYKDPGFESLILESKDWRKDFGTTRRSLDDWGECVAESFTLWSAGQPIKPEMKKIMDTLVRIET
jgi:hypothetical protein